MAILRLGIDGRWNAGEFAEMLMDFQDLYAFRYVVNRIWETSHNDVLPNASPPGSLQTIPRMFKSESLYAFVQPNELDLQVLRVRYGSKGFTDLVGVGKIIETIKDFAIRIIELGVSRDERRQKVKAMRIENARSMVALARDLGYSEKEIQSMVRWVDTRQGDLLHFAREGKLVEVNVREEDSNTDRNDSTEPNTFPPSPTRKIRFEDE